MFNSIFGSAAHAHAAQQMFGTRAHNSPQGLANQSSLAQQQANTYSQGLLQSQLYNQMLNASRGKPRYVFNDIECATLQEFAQLMFPDDKESQMMLILKHGA